MDTRLLRGWSNFKYLSGRFVLNSFVIFLFTLCAAPAFALPAASHLQQEETALADVRLTWEASHFRFIGVHYLVFSSDEKATVSQSGGKASGAPNKLGIEFWMLPNRDLRKGILQVYSRDQRELGDDPSAVEWPYRDVGLGALLTKDTSVAHRSTLCPSSHEALEQDLSRLDWQPAESERHHDEQSLRLEVPQLAGTKCIFVRVSFVFEPRLGEGNFAVRPNGTAVFSGPIFPLWKSRPVFTRARFHAREPDVLFNCLGCRPSSEGAVETSFMGLPPPVELLRKSGKPTSKTLALVDKTGFAEAIGQLQASEEVSQTMQMFLRFAGGAIEKSAERFGKPWRISFRENILLEQLVLEQQGEIQFHSSFGKVNPLLSEYHRAALFRILSRSFLRHAFQSVKPVFSWNELRTTETLVRMVGEQWLHSGFPKLDRLRSLSDSLSFLPFFRAIQQGSAFLNNAVFLGAEEKQSALDFGLLHEALAPLDGSSLRARFLSCATLEDQLKFENISSRLADGSATPEELMLLLMSMKPTEECRAPLEAGLIPATFAKELVKVDADESGVKVLRETLPLPPLNEFLFGKVESTVRDALQIEWEDSKGKQNVRVWEATPPSTRLMFPPDVQRVQVVGLHPSTHTDKLRWPRPLRTVVQALALNYDSRRSDLMLRSQIQTTQLGDDWGRSLTLGFRREYLKNNFDLQLSTRVVSLVPETDGHLSLATTTRLESAPASFLAVSYGMSRRTSSVLYPEGSGLQIWFRRPVTLSALREVMRDPQQEWIFDFATGLAPRLTWSELISFGSGDESIDVGLRSVPGWPGLRFVTKEFFLVRSELRQTLTQNFNLSIGKSLLFQHAVLYGSHVAAFDRVRAEQDGALDARTAQSLVLGLRLFGALFGAKDQALTAEISRALDAPARTSFGFSLGKAAN